MSQHRALPAALRPCLVAALLAVTGCGGDGTRAADTSATAPDTSPTQDTRVAADTAAPADTGPAADTADDAAAAADTVGPGDTTPPAPLKEDYLLDDPLAYPESVTFDPVDRAFYTGSMARGNVLRTAADGAQTELFAGNDTGEWLILGLEADPPRRRLWVCAGEERTLVGSELWLLDLDTGERTWRVDLDAVQPGAVCIDVVVTQDGAAYVADRAFGKVYRADASKLQVTTFAADPLLAPGLIGANGIAVDAQERFLLVAKFLPPALVRVNLASPLDVADIDLINDTTDGFAGGVDGVTVLDGKVYLAIDAQLAQATPDPTWSYATLAFHDLTVPNGDPVSGVSGITVAEGALYLSKSDVTRFATGAAPELPFRVFHVPTTVFAGR